jgi:hypothetical protein
MDADESGKGQERFAGGPDTKHIGSYRPGLQFVSPAAKMLAEVAIEAASSAGIGTKCRKRRGWVWTREVDAVVAKEDPVTVGLVAVAGEVSGCRRDDFYRPASVGVPCRELLLNGRRVWHTDRQQVDVR